MSVGFRLKYATASFVRGIPIIIDGGTDFAIGADWTPAIGEVKIALDGAAGVNIATLPSYVADNGWLFTFSAAELTAKQATITVKAAAIEDQKIIVDLTSAYDDGFVHFDDSAANTNSERYIDGTKETPISGQAALKTIADLEGKKIRITGTLNDNLGLVGYEMFGANGDAFLNGVTPNGTGPDWSGAWINHVIVTGFGRMDNNTRFSNCLISAITGQSGDGFLGHATECSFNNNIVLKDTFGSESILNNCSAGGATPTFDYEQAANQHRLFLNNFSGKVFIDNMTDAGAFLEVYSDGDIDITINASCTLGTITLIGVGNLTDNGSIVPDLTKWQELPISDSSLTQQQVRDAMKLAPTGGAPGAGSVDEHLDDIDSKTTNLPVDPASESNVNDNETKIDLVLVDTGNIDGKTSQMVFTNANELDGNMKSIDDDSSAAETLKEAIPATEFGTVSGGVHSTTFIATSTLTGLSTDSVKFGVINFKTGTNRGRSAPITAYTTGTGAITLDGAFPLDAVPVNGDAFTIT